MYNFTLGEKIGAALICLGIVGGLSSIVFSALAIPSLVVAISGVLTYGISTAISMD